MQVNTVRTLTVRGTSQGLDKLETDLGKVSAAQERVTQTSEGMARTTETTSRRQLSAGRDFQRLMERNDRLVYLQTQLAKETGTVNRALEQGVIDVTRHAAAVEMLEAKYSGLVTAEQRARSQSEGLVVANDNLAQSMNRVAAANDNARGSTANVAAQFQDIGVTAAMGMSPVMIALQQGTQLSSVLMTMKNPLQGLVSAFMSLLNPVSLLTIGFVALAAVAIQWFVGAKEEADQAADALKLHDQWLDQILEGYGEIRDAAKLAGDEALKLPQALVELELSASLKKQADDAKELDAKLEHMRGGFEQTIGFLKEMQIASASQGENSGLIDGAIDQIAALRDIGLQADSTKEQLAGAMVTAREFYHAFDDDNLKGFADEVYQLALAIQKVQAQKAADEAARLAIYFDKLQTSGFAAAQGIRASYDAAVQASSGYVQAAADADGYAGAMQRLGAMIPVVAAAQAKYQDLKAAETDYNTALADNQKLLDAHGITQNAFIARQDAANQRFQQARDQITGLTDQTKALEEAEHSAYIGSLPAREAAAQRIRDSFEEQAKALKASGGTQDQMARLMATMNLELDNSAKGFDKVGSSAGGAAKAVKAAEKDIESFTSTADKFAEALFPGEYARREAEELMGLLDKYRDKLDSFQIAGVEKEIGNLNSAADQGLRHLEDRAKETGDEISKTLGSVLSSLFDGPMGDMDAFFDKALKGFASIGQQNLSKIFDSGENGEGGLLGAIYKATKEGTQKGAEVGSTKGILSLSQLSSYGSAALGGLGIGYQAQDPVMGGLGGAASGAMAGMAGGPVGMAIGAVIGGLAGFVGGLFGMNDALKKSKAKVEENRMAIDQFIAAANGDPISRYAKTLADFNKQAKELIALANAAHDTSLAKKLKAANDNIEATLGKEFSKELTASVNNLRGEGWINQVSAAQDAYNMRLKDAALLGVDAGNAMTELSLTLGKIVTDGDLTAAQVARLVKLFPDLAKELKDVAKSIPKAGELTLDAAQSAVERARSDLRSAYDAEATALNGVIDRNKQFIASLRDFKASLKLDQSLSGLSPQDRFMEAKRQFDATSKAALGGDETAMARLEEVSRNYLAEAKGFYASSDQYFQIFAQVQAMLDKTISKAENRVTDAELQLKALTKQIDLLIDIDKSVMTVAHAVNALAKATANLATVQAGGHVTLPKFANGGSFMIGGNGGIDQNLLSINGRAAAHVGRGEIVNIRPAQSGNDNGELLAEIRALRQENAALSKQLIATVGAGAKVVAEAASETTEAVKAGNRQSSQASLKRTA